jgi:hypothetical protein
MSLNSNVTVPVGTSAMNIPVSKRSRPVTSIVRLRVELSQVRGRGRPLPTAQAHRPTRTLNAVVWQRMCSATAVRLAAPVLRVSADN